MSSSSFIQTTKQYYYPVPLAGVTPAFNVLSTFRDVKDVINYKKQRALFASRTIRQTDFSIRQSLENKTQYDFAVMNCTTCSAGPLAKNAFST